jgi:hypothetical protein
MMNMLSSTSMMSISEVVLSSIIGSEEGATSALLTMTHLFI